MSSKIIVPLPNKKVASRERVAPSEEVKKWSGTLYDIEEPVVTIRQNYLDDKIEKDNNKKYYFQGHSAISTRWFGPDHEWLEAFFLHLNRISIQKIF